jgi:hypothetical protein
MRRSGIRGTVLEGYRLGHRLMVAARENGADDPQHFLQFLRQKRRGYSAEHDGPSELMRLVDDIRDHELRRGSRP